MRYLHFDISHCRDCSTVLRQFTCPECGYLRPMTDLFRVRYHLGAYDVLGNYELREIRDALYGGPPLHYQELSDVLDDLVAEYLQIGAPFDLAPLTPAELLVRPTPADYLVEPGDNSELVDPDTGYFDPSDE